MPIEGTYGYDKEEAFRLDAWRNHYVAKGVTSSKKLWRLRLQKQGGSTWPPTGG